jgi:hypothetical protein
VKKLQPALPFHIRILSAMLRRAYFARVWIRRTDMQLKADMVNLVERMAAATNRGIEWQEQA